MLLNYNKTYNNLKTFEFLAHSKKFLSNFQLFCLLFDLNNSLNIIKLESIDKKVVDFFSKISSIKSTNYFPKF